VSEAAAGESPCGGDKRAVRLRLFTAGLPDPDLLIRTGGSAASATFSSGRWRTPSSILPKSSGPISGAALLKAIAITSSGSGVRMTSEQVRT